MNPRHNLLAIHPFIPPRYRTRIAQICVLAGIDVDQLATMLLAAAALTFESGDPISESLNKHFHFDVRNPHAFHNLEEPQNS
jgi:hypothetical protein